MRLADCGIKDRGATALFNEIAKSKSVQRVDLSGNPLTDKCFDAIESCLSTNKNIK